THDRADVLATADRVVVMHAGRVRQVGAVTEVFGRPADAAVAALVGVETVVEGRVVETTAALATVEVGTARLTAVNPGGPSGSVLLAVVLLVQGLLERGPEQIAPEVLAGGEDRAGVAVDEERGGDGADHVQVCDTGLPSLAVVNLGPGHLVVSRDGFDLVLGL